MPDKDILIEKTNHMQRCLKRIGDVTAFKPESLENQDIQDIVVFNLQRAIQAAIDMAVHIVTSEGWGVAKTVNENFTILAKQHVISNELAERLRKMVGFRNIAIHDYSELDIKILKQILKHSLQDLEVFYSNLIGKYAESAKN